MTASIGGNEVLRISGEFQTLAEEVEVITRPNVDGAAYRTMGQRSTPFRMTSVVDVDDAADAETLADTYKALKGTLVTIVDDHGQTHNYVAVLDVDIVRKKKLIVGVGGLSASMGYLVEAAWTLQETV